MPASVANGSGEVSRPFLPRVKIRNFKSIGACHVELRPLTLVVGRNGAGKSNFLDALRFVVDALRTSLDHAIRDQGGLEDVRRRSTGHPRNFSIELQVALRDARLASYGFEVAARRDGAFAVKWERVEVKDKRGRLLDHYCREGSKILSSSSETMPPVLEDRLFLVNAAGLPPFREVFDQLIAMGFYNLNPKVMKELQQPDAGELLHADGANLASVVARLRKDEPAVLERIQDYLSTIVPELTEVDRVALGPRETLQFWQRVKGSEHPWKFYASSMSDGTLRALGALVAVAQLADRKQPVRLVGIEEPETALHPAAAGALMDALREAASRTQVLLTTHSPDLLDQIEIDRDGLLVVVAEEGTTKIAPADAASLDAIRSHLYPPGSLLRMDQLQPDRADFERQLALDLFATGVEAA